MLKPFNSNLLGKAPPFSTVEETEAVPWEEEVTLEHILSVLHPVSSLPINPHGMDWMWLLDDTVRAASFSDTTSLC